MTRDVRSSGQSILVDCLADNTAEGMDNEPSSIKKSGKNGQPSQGNSHQFPWGIYTSISESPTPDFIVESLDMEAPISDANTTEDIFLIPTQNA